MVAPANPHPESVERGEKNSQAGLLAQGKQIVPQLHHFRLEAAGRLFQIAVLAAAVFEHQTDARHAVCGQHSQMTGKLREISPPEAARKIRPGDRAVMPDWSPRLA